MFKKLFACFVAVVVAVGALSGALTALGSGTEYSAVMTYRVGSSNWLSFNQGFANGDITGLKIQTDNSRGYYLSYAVKGVGKAGFYPYVNSNTNDFAGGESTTPSIDEVKIQVMDTYGNKISSGIVVMYRAYTQGRWLPWVSNAEQSWMESVKVKYNLDGKLDFKSGYAGIAESPITALEIHIFEETDSQQYVVLTDSTKAINVQHICQNPSYPTGCESVSTVMALNYAGIEISVDDFIANYLPKGDADSFDPNICFGGNPASNTGMGCYAPAIKTACDSLFSALMLSTGFKAQVHNDMSLDALCKNYIDRGCPVVVWATCNMVTPHVGKVINYEGRQINWLSPEHCLVLVGYDDVYYYFSDPQKTESFVGYLKADAQSAFEALGSQALTVSYSEILHPDFLRSESEKEIKGSYSLYESKYSGINLYDGNCEIKLELPEGMYICYDTLAQKNSYLGTGWYFGFQKRLEIAEDKLSAKVYWSPAVYSVFTATEGGFVDSDGDLLKRYEFDEPEQDIYELRKNKDIYRFSEDGYITSYTDDNAEISYTIVNGLNVIPDVKSNRYDTVAICTTNNDGTLVNGMRLGYDYNFINFVYSDGYLVTVNKAGVPIYNFYYNDDGLIEKIITDNSSVITLVYDNDGRVVQKTEDNSLVRVNYGKSVIVNHNYGGLFERRFNENGKLVYAKGAGSMFSAKYYDTGKLKSRVFYLLGDVNLDGDVDLLDLVKMKKICAYGEDFDADACDFDGDKEVTATDISELKNYFIGNDSYIYVEYY